VPLDDASLDDGPAISLALVRIPARDSSRRIGSLVVNPGGPGASGVDMALGRASALPDEIRDRFDIVGFDPRGVGDSAPVDCTDDLDPLNALDWAPSTVEERKDLTAGWQDFVDACESAMGQVLSFLTTERTARDLDLIRAALGDDQLTYYGASYGTYLGAWYAEQFPDRVRALVLDGAVDPALDARALQIQQSVAFERDLALFLADCRNDPDCAFHRDGRPGKAYDALRARIDVTPLPADDAGDSRTLNTTRFDLGVTQILYSGRAAWGELAAVLDAADRGDGSELLFAADSYFGRNDDGTYSDFLEAFIAIGCADGPSVGGVEGLRSIEEIAGRKAPRLGRSIVNNSFACALWPVTAPEPKELHGKGAAPILVLGTRNDPATPVAWAVSLAKQLESGVLLTAGGEQHGAYLMGNDCIDAAVDRYLVDLVVPTNPTRC